MRAKIASSIFSWCIISELTSTRTAARDGGLNNRIPRLHWQVALVDPSLCTSLSSEQTVTMAMTALSACVDTLLASELGNPSPSKVAAREHLRDLGMKGIGAVREGLPRVLESNDAKARELLTVASLCAGQASAMASATVLPTQVHVDSYWKVEIDFACFHQSLRCLAALLR